MGKAKKVCNFRLSDLTLERLAELQAKTQRTRTDLLSESVALLCDIYTVCPLFLQETAQNTGVSVIRTQHYNTGQKSKETALEGTKNSIKTGGCL